MRKKLYSIIVPVYNCEQYLEKCLNSLLKQSYKNIEIILINDGSNDNSEKICLNYKKLDSRIKYYKKDNGGVSSARNLGINVCNGDYITLIASDQMAIQFKLDEINPVGKTAKGVKGIALNENATVIQVNVGPESKTLPVQHRAGKGNRISF